MDVCVYCLIKRSSTDVQCIKSKRLFKFVNALVPNLKVSALFCTSCIKYLQDEYMFIYNQRREKKAYNSLTFDGLNGSKKLKDGTSPQMPSWEDIDSKSTLCSVQSDLHTFHQSESVENNIEIAEVNNNLIEQSNEITSSQSTEEYIEQNINVPKEEHNFEEVAVQDIIEEGAGQDIIEEGAGQDIIEEGARQDMIEHPIAPHRVYRQNIPNPPLSVFRRLHGG